MPNQLVFLERDKTVSILDLCPFLQSIRRLPSNHFMATYDDNSLGGPDYIKAVQAADRFKCLVTNLVDDVLDTPAEEARLAVGDRVLLAPFAVFSSCSSFSTYTYLYNKKESYRFPPTLSLHEGFGETVYWFIFKQGCLSRIGDYVASWKNWADKFMHVDRISWEFVGEETLKISAPEGVHDPIIALYMMFIQKKREQRMLRIMLSGGTLDAAIGMRKYAFE